MDKPAVENRGIDDKLFNKVLMQFDSTPACHTMGIRVKYLGQGTAGLTMTVTKELINSLGVIHGGYVAALADTAMGYAIITLGLKVLTLDLNLNYLAPALLGTELRAEASVLHAGKNTVVSEATLHDSDNKLVSKSRGTFFIARTAKN